MGCRAKLLIMLRSTGGRRGLMAASLMLGLTSVCWPAVAKAQQLNPDGSYPIGRWPTPATGRVYVYANTATDDGSAPEFASGRYPVDMSMSADGNTVNFTNWDSNGLPLSDGSGAGFFDYYLSMPNPSQNNQVNFDFYDWHGHQSGFFNIQRYQYGDGYFTYVFYQQINSEFNYSSFDTDSAGNPLPDSFYTQHSTLSSVLFDADRHCPISDMGRVVCKHGKRHLQTGPVEIPIAVGKFIAQRVWFGSSVWHKTTQVFHAIGKGIASLPTDRKLIYGVEIGLVAIGTGLCAAAASETIVGVGACIAAGAASTVEITDSASKEMDPRTLQLQSNLRASGQIYCIDPTACSPLVPPVIP